MAVDRWGEEDVPFWMMVELRHEMAQGPKLPDAHQCFACLGRDGQHQPDCTYDGKQGG